MATEHNSGATSPPKTYGLNEVSIRVTQSPGRAVSSKNNILKLNGAGSSSLEREGQPLPFFYTPKAMLTLLNHLYRIRFFEMSADYSVGYSVFLKDDGSIGTQALKMSDAPNTRVCFSVPAYEKCVTYGAHGPRELEDVVQKLLTEANGLVSLPPPLK